MIYIWWGNIIRENFPSGIGFLSREKAITTRGRRERMFSPFSSSSFGRERPVFLNGNKSPGAIRRRARNWAADLLPNTPTSSFFFFFSPSPSPSSPSTSYFTKKDRKEEAGRQLLLLYLPVFYTEKLSDAHRFLISSRRRICTSTKS